MRDIDQIVPNLLSDNEALEDFIVQNETFILSTASKFTKRYISKSDEEWIIALTAFHRAIEKYEYKKGSFFAFAKLSIKRSLIDYFRSQQRFNSEFPIDTIEDNTIKEKTNEDLKLEIQAIHEVLKNYGFSFMDLIECSPKADKTRRTCFLTIRFLLENPLLLGEMRETKQIPIKIIERTLGLPRKTLDRHRKYIIAAVEILIGDCPNLAEYLSDIREE